MTTTSCCFPGYCLNGLYKLQISRLFKLPMFSLIATTGRFLSGSGTHDLGKYRDCATNSCQFRWVMQCNGCRLEVPNKLHIIKDRLSVAETG